MQRIGVRDLRQQASRYLKRVQAGEAFEVTDNGRPVARLVPVPPDPWQGLIDSGQVIPAEIPGGLRAIQPLDFGIDASALVKLVHIEVQSAALHAYLEAHPSARRVTSMVSRTEVLRAVWQAGGPHAQQHALRVLEQTEQVAVTRAVLDQAGALLPRPAPAHRRCHPPGVRARARWRIADVHHL